MPVVCAWPWNTPTVLSCDLQCPRNRVKSNATKSEGVEMVPEAGFEPARPCGHGLLRPTWLPLHHSGALGNVILPLAGRGHAVQRALQVSGRGLRFRACDSGTARRPHRTSNGAALVIHPLRTGDT